MYAHACVHVHVRMLVVRESCATFKDYLIIGLSQARPTSPMTCVKHAHGELVRRLQSQFTPLFSPSFAKGTDFVNVK